MISVLIFTRNEEQNLLRCLSAVDWSDDVVVLDSRSEDRSVEIAKRSGARVVQRLFDSWAEHHNWATANIDFKHRWVYQSDADEVVTPELRDEMLQAVQAVNNPFVAYRLRFKVMFMGRWLRHSSLYPTWVLRLYQPNRVRWSRRVNPVAEAAGPVGRLSSHFEHYSFSKGLAAWLDKHNEYSDAEALEALEGLQRPMMSWRSLIARDPAERRAKLKELSTRLPCRPLLRFSYMYLLRGGFLDGYPGYTYCRLLAIYEYMIVLKMQELRRRAKDLPT